MFKWIKNVRNWIEAKVAKVLPGWKVKALNAISAVSIIVTAVAAYLSSVDISAIIDAKTALVITFIINTLSFWLKDITARVESREDA